MFSVKNSKINFNVHVLFWFLLTLYPSVMSLAGSTSLAQRVMHVFFFVFFSVAIVFFQRQPCVERKYLDCFLIYLLLTLAYYGVVTLAHSGNLQMSDLVDLARPIVYFCYFVFPLFFPLDEMQFRKFFKYLLIFCMIQIAFSSLVYFDCFWPLVNIYKGRMSDDIQLFHFFRWSGTFGYPADFSFFLSFFIYFLFLSLRYRLFGKWRIVAGLLLMTTALILTLSRGGLVTVAVMLAVASFMYKRGRGLLYYTFIALMSGLVVYLALNFIEGQKFNFAYVSKLYEEGVEAPSASHRVIELKLAWHIMLENFPIGIGPNRGEIGKVLPVIETSYGHYLIKWGVLGWLLYMVSVLYTGRLSYRIWKTHADRYVATFAGAMFLLIISVPLVFGFSSAITDRYKVLPFYYVMLGYLVMLAANNRKRLQSSLFSRHHHG
ncbi:MAG: O-antigen ligase family protein [Proteobacteria bacterium]|nr:O-antigen ligase family protein [Pseudomonadota bacterium]MBU1738861.1 O-antigen ligase family protein [Pseudomonadota bacterium]